ncbi:hypothetical protein K435DRAFT_855349 [Dendrothele bispora CBS 962.96]|uniref:Uncharacterized protein n=1 Tax=Dendrothele bispora (strain CBS 962.96) TaxID=1314807 RepID=A0A4S8MBJ3_DENBC|nr:hypothetical protein K435DRAFT_855349 [Dendrothele bispora CBS 962.96]
MSLQSLVDSFVGCSPQLIKTISPNGTGKQNFKYYLVLGGAHAGIYLDQSLASAQATATGQKTPKGYKDEEQKGGFPNVTDNITSAPRDPHLAQFLLTQLLSTEAAPFPHNPVPSPSARIGSSSSPNTEERSPTKKAKNLGSYHPRKPTNVVVDNTGSGYASSSSEQESEARVLSNYFVVKFKGGFDLYTSQADALVGFMALHSKGLDPQMRVSNDFTLAQEFMGSI